MSELSAKLQKWREQGSLRFLSVSLGVSAKQVSRYWDSGWIDGTYASPKGHRRVHYTDETVERVARTVIRAKETNIAIRYHVPSIEYCDTHIPVKGCTKMQDVYQRARKAGLDDRQAWNAVHSISSLNTEPSDSNRTWEFLLAMKGTSQKEVDESTRMFVSLPLECLINAEDDKDFRARAIAAWQKIVSTQIACSGWAHLPPPEKAKRLQPLEPLRNLLHKRDLKSFIVACDEFFELQNRILEYDDEKYRAVLARAKGQPKTTNLQIAALSLRHSGQDPSAAALAQAIGISRPALYRRFGGEEIQAALKLLRNDSVAIRETRNLMLTKGKKSNLAAGKQDA